jgi:hypothetical protein
MFLRDIDFELFRFPARDLFFAVRTRNRHVNSSELSDVPSAICFRGSLLKLRNSSELSHTSPVFCTCNKVLSCEMYRFERRFLT